MHMPNIFIGENPQLEAVYENKGSERCVVITHPHSLMGGNMHNNVVMAAWDAALQKGLSVLRFNFRGVGRSGGSFDEGNGEIHDIATAAEYVKQPVIIGYSFGSWVAAGYVKRLDNPLPCIFVSPPTGMFQFPSMKNDNVWAITGDQDQFCNIPMLEGLMDANRITVVKHADHFWFGDEEMLKTYLSEKLEQLISAS
jgi:uncharacterized protein